METITIKKGIDHVRFSNMAHSVIYPFQKENKNEKEGFYLVNKFGENPFIGYMSYKNDIMELKRLNFLNADFINTDIKGTSFLTPQDITLLFKNFVYNNFKKLNFYSVCYRPNTMTISIFVPALNLRIEIFKNGELCTEKIKWVYDFSYYFIGERYVIILFF